MNQDRKFSSNVISSNTFWLSWLNMYMAGWPKTSKQKHWAHYTSLYIRLYKYTQANIQRNWPPLWNIEPATMQYTVTPTHHIILIYLQTLNCCLLSTNIATAVPKHFSLSNIFQQLHNKYDKMDTQVQDSSALLHWFSSHQRQLQLKIIKFVRGIWPSIGQLRQRLVKICLLQLMVNFVSNNSSHNDTLTRLRMSQLAEDRSVVIVTTALQIIFCREHNSTYQQEKPQFTQL